MPYFMHFQLLLSKEEEEEHMPAASLYHQQVRKQPS